MLNENLKAIRKSKGLSQEELAIRLNVVRQKSWRGSTCCLREEKLRKGGCFTGCSSYAARSSRQFLRFWSDWAVPTWAGITAIPRPLFSERLSMSLSICSSALRPLLLSAHSPARS